MAITSLDGAAFERFVAAGTYFLRKYQGVLNDLNVFPVPDGDTGSNMYLTARAAMQQARRVRGEGLASVASAAAQGSLIGARGNSGEILSQMLRGFAHTVRDSDAIDTRQVAAALHGAVAAARAALSAPVEGTMISVAQSAADAAHRIAPDESDFVRFGEALVRAANAALERTPEQLPALKAAGVVDSGAAGLCYFLEGALQFVPERRRRATAFPRRPERRRVFHAEQHVGEHRYCTEFVVHEATLDADALRALLAPYGDSLIVAGEPPTLKAHLHTARPDDVQTAARAAGRLDRVKVDDMAQQHRLLVVDVPPETYATVAVVPGPGFERIARELGAEVTVPFGERGPSIDELVVAVNATFADRVYLLPNDPKIALAAGVVASRTRKTVRVLPTRDIVAGLAAQIALGNGEEPAALAEALQNVRSAALFRTGSSVAAALDGRLHTARSLRALLFEVVAVLGGDDGGLVTLYYGGRQRERDAKRYASALGERFGAEVEVVYGGQPAVEYWVSVER
jgi:DAK2 domain fusion protein YloV